MVKKERILCFISLIIIMSLDFATLSYWSDEVAEAYKYGEPDYSDGDLEDKLGDSGYYYDLFPEERADEADDSSYSNNSSKSSSTNNQIIKSIKIYEGGRWEKVPAKSLWSTRQGYHEKDYDWVFYPKNSSKCLSKVWAIIDNKLYHFDIHGYMIHNSNDWINSYLENLYSLDDGAYCQYRDYQENGNNANTDYRQLIPDYIKIVK